MRVNTPAVMWTLGLGEEQRKIVEAAAGAGYVCCNLDASFPEALSDILDRADVEDPLLLWLGEEAWSFLRQEHPDILEKMSTVPIVLVLDENPDRDVMEQALQAPVQQVVLAPLGRAQVQGGLKRAMEAHGIYREMKRMAREVSVERELFERKADVCSFLFQFFIQAAETENGCTLASGCADVMREFCGLDGLHIAWWGSGKEVSYILGVDSCDLSSLNWYEFLREQARELKPDSTDGACVNWNGQSEDPAQDKVLTLPMFIRGECCGLLALRLEEPMLQSRDMAQALDVVRRHLAVALMEGSGHPNFFQQSEKAYLLPQERKQILQDHQSVGLL